MAGLYVEPQFRRQGIAASLIKYVQQHAAKFGYDEIYLWTHTAEVLYIKLGWKVVERIDCYGKRIAVMRAARDVWA